MIRNKMFLCKTVCCLLQTCFHICPEDFDSEAAATIFWRDRNLLHLQHQPNLPWQGWRVRNRWCQKFDDKKNVLWLLDNWNPAHLECCTIWDAIVRMENDSICFMAHNRNYPNSMVPAWETGIANAKRKHAHTFSHGLCQFWKTHSNWQFVTLTQIMAIHFFENGTY